MSYLRLRKRTKVKNLPAEEIFRAIKKKKNKQYETTVETIVHNVNCEFS